MFQNQEILTEGEIRSNLDVSEKERDLQDHIADLKAEVCTYYTNTFFNVQISVHMNTSSIYL